MLVIFAGVNYYRLRDKKQTNPQIVVFLLPFIVNVNIKKFSTYLPSQSSKILILSSQPYSHAFSSFLSGED